MTTRQGVDSTIYYDPAKIWERYELRPDQMIDYKALKGDPTDNIPGIPGVGRRPPRSWSASSARSRASTNGWPRSSPTSCARSSSRRVSRYSQPRALPNRPRPADRFRPGGCPTLRLRPRRGREALPRVRVPDVDPIGCRRSRVSRRWTRPRRYGPSRGRWLAARVAAAPAESPGSGGPRGGGVRERGRRSRNRQLGRKPGPAARHSQPLTPRRGRRAQLTMDFGSTGLTEPDPGLTPAASRPRPTGDAGPVDLAAALRAAVADPALLDRFEATDEDAADATAWLAGREGWPEGRNEIGAALLMDDPRPMRGMPQRSLWRAATAACWSRRATTPWAALATSCSAPGRMSLATRPSHSSWRTSPAVRSSHSRRLRHSDRGVLAQRITPLPNHRDVAHERLDVTFAPRRGRSAGGPHRPRRAGCARRPGAAREGPGRGRLDRLFREIELPLIPVLAEMEAAGVAIDREALALLDTEFSARWPGWSRRSTWTSGTSSTSDRPSSSSRSSSTS